METKNTYKAVVKFEHAMRGSYSDLSYRPVFRASAIFFVLVSKHIDTLISFMNYWKEKNDNDQVSAMVTLRDGNGQKIYREFFPIKSFVYQFSVRELIQPLLDLMGSIEIELFSSQDLKYSFPAIEAFYESPDGVSFVHSNQRVFGDIEDMDRGIKLNDWQTGFDIYANNQQSGYITVINGQRAVPNAKIEFLVFNSAGEVLKDTISLGNLPAYASRMVLIKDIPDAEDFLKDEVGFCKVKIDTFGIFMRIACGNIYTNHRRMTVTHSFYDCTNDNEYYQESEISEEEITCFTPISLIDGLETELILYPTYSRSTLIPSLDCFAKDGSLRKKITDIGRHVSPDTKMLRINIRELLRKHQVPADLNSYCFVLKSVGNKIPTRLAHGLNYYKTGIGCNINDSIWLNQGYGKRSRIFVWGAGIYREGSKNWLLVSHFSKIRGIQEKANITIKIYAKTGVIIEKTYTTHHPTTLNIALEELISESRYLPRENEVLWYTAESSCPNYISKQIHISKTGFVAGCHSF